MIWVNTSLDMRKYDYINPNRLTAVQIPEVLINKLEQFMNYLGLTTASIDLVETIDGKYILLDINPYGMVGHFDECDIDLSNMIYDYLIK